MQFKDLVSKADEVTELYNRLNAEQVFLIGNLNIMCKD